MNEQLEEEYFEQLGLEAEYVDEMGLAGNAEGLAEAGDFLDNMDPAEIDEWIMDAARALVAEQRAQIRGKEKEWAQK